MNKQSKFNQKNSKLILEELEERRLFSGGIEGLVGTALDSEAQAIYADADANKAKSDSTHDETAAAAAEQQSQEFVFVDAGVENYQQLVNDLRNNADSSRKFEVVVLDKEQDGIEQISDVLQDVDDLDAIHIISHGSDGNVELGNTSLDADSLQQNNLKIALWANSFAETGDILIYGCNLAASEVGQGLISELSELTLTDVAASDDLTGQADLGGDWVLEYSRGEVETAVAVSTEAQGAWQALLATETVRDNFETASYSNNDGTQSWSTGWVETDDGGSGASGGEIFVDGTDLRIRARADGDNIYREANLSGATAATLTFDVVDNRLEVSDIVRLQVSDDGGGSWVTLKDFTGADPNVSSESFDITGSIAANTQVRFLVVGNGDDRIHVDNVQIQYTTTGNQVPVITSDGGGATANINVAENTTAVTTVTATDADLDTLTYSISGGTDAALFSIDANSGVLTFNAAPDFENPADANTDNVYEVIVQTDDGNTGTDVQAITVTVTDEVVETMQMITGSYVGDGVDGHSITGLGFAPDLVIIKQGVSGQSTVVSTSAMTGDVTKTLVGGTAEFAGAIKSLDADGFQLGTNATVNSAGQTYYWTAFVAAAGEMSVGTYTGDGTDDRSITGIGFQSDYAIVMGAGAEEAVQRFQDQVGDASLEVGSSAVLTNVIQAFEADGFQVGSDSRVNQAGQGYYYITWKEVAGKTAFGTYTGDGTDNRAITDVGFEPEYVLVTLDGAGDSVHRTDSLAGDNTLGTGIDGAYADGIQQFLPTGFEVGTHITVNWSGQNYYYAAFNADGLNDAPTDIVFDSESSAEQTVNSYGASDQIDPAIAAFDDGGYIAVWVSNGQDGSGYGIYGQRFNADGTVNGVEFLVTSETTDSETNPSVATFSDGGFIVTWQDQTSGVMAWTEARVYDADGTAATADFRVSPGVDGDYEGYQPAVVTLNDNEFVVVWANEIGGSTYEVAGQIYDRAGAAVGSQFSAGSLLSGTGLFGAQTEVTRLDDGGFAVAWRTHDGTNLGTNARVMNADGSARTAVIVLGGDNITDIASLSSGNFVVTYDDAGALKAAIYDANGILVTAEFTVNTTTSIARYESTVTRSEDGFIVVWESSAGDGSGSAILAQRFDANANKIDGEIVVNQTSAGNQQKPEVIETASGQIIAVWQSDNVDGAATGIASRVVTTGTASVDENAINGTRVADVLGVLDIDSGDTHTYALVDDATGRFSINATTGEISVADGSLLDYESNSSHNVTVRVTDSGGLTYDEVLSISVIDANDAPVVDLNGSNGGGIDFATSFLEGDAAVSITDTDAIISDVDDTSFQQLGINLSSFSDGTSELISVGGYSFSYGTAEVIVRTVGGTDFEIDFDGTGFTIMKDAGGNMPLADAQTLIRGITYENTSQNPTTGDRSIDIQIQDTGGLLSTNATSTITVGAENDAPVVTASGGVTAYSEQAVATVIDAALTLVDPDGFDGTDPSDQYVGVINITGNYEAADILGFTNTANIQGVLTGSQLVLTVIGGQTATVADFEAALQSVTFYNGSNAPGTLDRSITFAFDDGVDSSNITTKTVQVSATNDTAVISGADTGSVTEDVSVVSNNISTAGLLNVADPDTGESSFQAGTINGSYGDLVIDAAGNWSYTADNTQAAIQNLDVSETLTDTLLVTSFDGTTHNVIVTINGAEDAPVIGGTSVGTVAEDGTLTASNTLTITDVDTSDNPISFNDVAATIGDNGYGNFEITGNTWTFTLNNAHASVQALDVGETLNDTFTFTASDGSTQVVTVTINGAEDGSIIGGTAVGAVAEDGTLTATDTLTITDVDTNDNPISFNDVAATIGDNGYGNFEITGNTWTFTLNNGHAAVQALDVGETLNDTYTFTASDGSTQVVTVTINGAEDGSIIGGTAVSTVAEDGTLTATDTLTITDADTSDNPISFNDVAATLGDNGYGNFEITGNTWTFTLNNGHASVQALDVGETLNDTYTFTASDGSTQVVTVTINGAEDAAVIGGTAVGAVAEDGTLTSSNTLTIVDTDTSDNPISFNDVAATIGDNGYGNFEITGNSWTYTLNNGHASVQALDVGETLNDTFTFTASDGSTQVVTVTINGAEDAAVIGGTSVGAVTEDGTLTASNTLTIIDADTSDNPISFNDVAATLGDNGYGNFEITGNTWTFTLNNGHAAVQALDVGETLNDTFTFTASDGSTQVVTVTINGAEDAPVIGGTSVGTVTEDGTLTASNTLTITDADTSDNPISFNDVAATIGDNGYGNFEITGNAWTYTLNNGHASVQALDVGETLNDTYNFTASDGSTQVVTVTINGAEDGSVIGGTAVGAVAEDGALTATDTLSITDADTSDNPISFNDVAATIGDNGYGNFEITGNTWTFTLNNGHASVQALDVGETLNDTYTFTASDGSTQVVTVTINGAEDAAVIGGTAVGAVAEDGTLTASNTLTITDADTSDNPISFNDVVATAGDNDYGNFEITSNTWTFTLNNGHASVQALDVGEILTDTYTFTASDGSTQTVTVTINGTEDIAVIGGTAVGVVAEDGTLTASDTLTITDADTSDNPISFNDIAATIGNNGYGNFEITGNTWTYTLNNAHTSVQALDVGDTLNDTFTFTASDGSTQVVTVTINGAEDAAVIGGTSVGAVAEDGTLTTSDTLTITDVDTSDNPISFNDVAATLGDNGYGNFEITGNTWTFTLNNGHTAVQALDVGQTLNDTVTFTASDGSTQVVTVTINGAEDAAVIGGTSTGNVAEDGTLTASNTLTITDADSSDNPISFNDVATTLGDNGYGNFEITGNTWTYILNNGNAAVQALDVGENLSDSFTFTASDGSTQVVTVTINGAEDAPTLDNIIADQAATEDIAFSYTFAANTFGDLDSSDTLTYTATLSDNSPLPAWLTFDGLTRTFSGTPGNGDVGPIDIKVTADDGSSSIDDIFTLTVNNTNDPAVIGGVDTGSVTEDVAVVAGNLNASGTMTIADPDVGESSFQAATINGTYGDLTIYSAGNWSYTAANNQAAIQALDTGENLIDTLTVTTFDGTTHDVAITINGSEDAPVIGGISTGSVTEDGIITTNNSLTITDVDSNDNPVSFNDMVPALGDNGYGNFGITANTWTYSLNNGHAAVQALAAGGTLTDSFTFIASDGSTQLVTVTINGASDAPVIGGASSATVTEDVGVVAGNISNAGSLTITDADAGESCFQAGTINGSYGDLIIDTAGNWSYSAANSQAAIQQLDSGQSVVDTLSVTTFDGTTQDVVITINGSEDAAVIGGTASGTVAEDGSLIVSDTLTISDIDTNDNPISFNDVAPTLGDNGYGNFEITANTWTYTLNNSHAAVQALDVGESLTDTYSFIASDGSTQVVSVTINGAEDGSVIGGTATGAVTEDGTLTASNTLTITDADTSDNPINFNDVAATLGDNGYGNFEITGNTWTFTLNNGHASVQALDVGETLNDTFTFTASDGSTQVVIVTINGTEDAPVIGGTSVGAVTEDGTLTASNTLTITDADTSDNPVSFIDVAATLGDNGFGNFEITGNTWTFTLNNGHASVQALDVGETLNDTFTFTASDGSTQIVTITINGAEDGSVIGGTATGMVVEDGTLTASNSLTITDVDTSDNPVNFNNVAVTLGDNGYGNFEVTANTWTFTLNNAHASVQALDAGEMLTDTYTFTASDGSTQVVTVTINGAEDTAVIGGTATGTVAEDGSLTTSNSLTITDMDSSDNPISFNDLVPTLGANGYGNFEITGNTWTYTLNNAHASVQALDAGESLVDTYTFTASDGSTQVVTVTINGAEDAAVIGGTATGMVAEDGSLTASNTLTISDTDSNDNPISFNDVLPTLGVNGYGNFEINANTWTYTLNNAHASVQALDVGETLVDTHAFIASDGSMQLVTVTINGAEDGSVIGGTATGAVAEDGSLTASNTLTITDTDTTDNPIGFNDVAPTLGGNGYGNFEITANSWTYTLNNGHAAVQALDAGEILIDTFTFTASDGSTQLVTITISGAEDAPTLDNAVADQTATRSFAFSFTFAANTFGDLDTSDTLTYIATQSDSSPLPAWLSFDALTRTFSGTPAAGDVGAINVMITANDGSSTVSEIFILTVDPFNNVPLIGGDSTGVLTEDVGVVNGNITDSGQLTIVDPDIGESSFVAQTIQGSFGGLTIDLSGNWSYRADNSHASIQGLQAGDSVTETLAVTTADGSTHNVVITINGAAEAPPIPPPVVEPPDDEPPPDEEVPPPEEEAEEQGGDDESSLDDIIRVPQDTTPPASEEAISSVTQSDDEEGEPVNYGPKDNSSANHSQVKASQPESLTIDTLTLQVSDDEALNEQYEQELLSRIDRMHFGMDNEAAQQDADDVNVQIVVGSTASLTVGIVSWVLRGGALLASFMSTVPLLNRFDPLPILKAREDEEDVEPDEDEDTDTQTSEHARKVDNMFSGKGDSQQ